MGMLAAWSILNRVASPRDDRFSDTVLIVCPNVTIRERLQELDPALGDLSLYRTRQLVPPHRMEELRRGEVMIANWHRLAKKETNTRQRRLRQGGEDRRAGRGGEECGQGQRDRRDEVLRVRCSLVQAHPARAWQRQGSEPALADLQRRGAPRLSPRRRGNARKASTRTRTSPRRTPARRRSGSRGWTGSTSSRVAAGGAGSISASICPRRPSTSRARETRSASRSRGSCRISGCWTRSNPGL